MSVRCKFRCDSVTPVYPSCVDSPVQVALAAVYDSVTTGKSVPDSPTSGLNVIINVPGAKDVLKVGAFYYLDLTPVA